MDMPPLHKRHLFFAAKTRLRPGAMSMDMALLRATPWVTGPAIEYAGYFSKKIEEVGRKRAICISPENVVSLLSIVRRAPDGALFSSPKGRFIVRAREKTVAQVVFSVAQIVFRVAQVVPPVARPPSSTVKYP